MLGTLQKLPVMHSAAQSSPRTSGLAAPVQAHKSVFLQGRPLRHQQHRRANGRLHVASAQLKEQQRAEEAERRLQADERKEGLVSSPEPSPQGDGTSVSIFKGTEVFRCGTHNACSWSVCPACQRQRIRQGDEMQSTPRIMTDFSSHSSQADETSLPHPVAIHHSKRYILGEAWKGPLERWSVCCVVRCAVVKLSLGVKMHTPLV